MSSPQSFLHVIQSSHPASKSSISFHSHHFHTALFCCCPFLIVHDILCHFYFLFNLAVSYFCFILVGFILLDQKVFSALLILILSFALFCSLYAKQFRNWQIFFFCDCFNLSPDSKTLSLMLHTKSFFLSIFLHICLVRFIQPKQKVFHNTHM